MTVYISNLRVHTSLFAIAAPSHMSHLAPLQAELPLQDSVTKRISTSLQGSESMQEL